MNMLGATTSTVDISKEKLMDDLRTVVADAEELLKATANQTGERIAAARVRAGDSLQAAKTRLSNAQEAVIEKPGLSPQPRMNTYMLIHGRP